MPELWEIQPGESLKAFAAFAIYRDLPTRKRSLDLAYRISKGRPEDHVIRASGLWQGWSVSNRWTERVAAYDAHLDAQRRSIREHRLRELEGRKIDFEIGFQDRIERRIAAIDRNLDRADEAPVADVELVEKTETAIVRKKQKGFSLSGYARLAKELREAAKTAANPLREIAPQAKPPGGGTGGESGGGSGSSGPAQFVWVKPNPPPSSDEK